MTEEYRIYELAEQASLDADDAFMIDQDGNPAARHITSYNLFAANPNPVAIGGGTPIANHVSTTWTWNPGNIGAGATYTYEVWVTGATYGDPTMCGLTSLTLAEVNLYGAVTSPGVVTVTIKNDTAGSVDLDEGTLRVCIWQYS